MVKKFSIVKVVKAAYDAAHVTKEDSMPRLLIIRRYDDSQQYLVRYPDNWITRISDRDITMKSTFEPDHPRYPTIAAEMRAVENQFRMDEIYQHVINEIHPAFALYLQQSIEAKHRAYQERHTTPANTIADITTIPTPEVTPSDDRQLALLESIDKGIQTLIRIWTGGMGNA